MPAEKILSSEISRPLLNKQNILQWAKLHYRQRSFHKDEQIPTRSGLIYLVEKGAIRLVTQLENEQEESFLGFVGTGQPFEILENSAFDFEAYAHVEETVIVWMYWDDVDNWPDFRQEIYDAFRYQHQRKLLLLTVLGQKRTIDRLMGFLTLLIEEYGQECEEGYYLPYLLTHAQIGTAISATRVTITRLIGRLRQQGIITMIGENLICLTHLDYKYDSNS